MMNSTPDALEGFRATARRSRPGSVLEVHRHSVVPARARTNRRASVTMVAGPSPSAIRQSARHRRRAAALQGFIEQLSDLRISRPRYASMGSFSMGAIGIPFGVGIALLLVFESFSLDGSGCDCIPGSLCRPAQASRRFGVPSPSRKAPKSDQLHRTFSGGVPGAGQKRSFLQ
jgi:hypothetical protein